MRYVGGAFLPPAADTDGLAVRIGAALGSGRSVRSGVYAFGQAFFVHERTSRDIDNIFYFRHALLDFASGAPEF